MMEQVLEQVERGSLTIHMDYADFADYWEPLLGGQGPPACKMPAASPISRARPMGRAR